MLFINHQYFNKLEYSRDLAFFGCYEQFEGKVVSSKGNCRNTCARLGHRFMSLSNENVGFLVRCCHGN